MIEPEMVEVVKSLLYKAEKASESVDALRYSQSALNAAHALVSISLEIDKQEQEND